MVRVGRTNVRRNANFLGHGDPLRRCGDRARRMQERVVKYNFSYECLGMRNFYQSLHQSLDET